MGDSATIGSESVQDLPERYLALLKQHLVRGQYRVPSPFTGSAKSVLNRGVQSVVRRLGYELVKPVDPLAAAEGRDYSSDADTMIGMRRLDNLQFCVTDVIRRGVPGDLIETGVWRGGASIFMRAMLHAYGDTERVVWVADSFQGVPKPDPSRYPADTGDPSWRMGALAIDIDSVKRNFESYGLLDDQVRFLPGWFRDTLPTAPISQLAVIRLDGDLYESTMDALLALYPKLSVGGYLIVDDYGDEVLGCRRAIDDFRAEHGITSEIHSIDWTGAYWQRSS